MQILNKRKKQKVEKPKPNLANVNNLPRIRVVKQGYQKIYRNFGRFPYFCEPISDPNDF